MKFQRDILTCAVVLLFCSGIASAQPPRNAADRRGAVQRGPGRRGPNRDAGSPTAGGGTGGFGGGLIWLVDSQSLRAELKLTEEQSEEFVRIAENLRQRLRDQVRAAPGADGERADGSREQAIKRAQEIEKQLAAILQPDQMRRLKQIELQQQAKFAGPSVFLQPTLAEALQLTAPQRQDLGDLINEL